MIRTVFMGLAMLFSAACFSGAALADEPTLHQVYQTAQSGNLAQAQTMMHQVLQAHPESGKAHYVEAELLAKQGQFQKAAAELATAERLAPGLPFAKPQAVQNLKGLLGSSNSGSARTASQQPLPQALAVPPGNQGAFPWGLAAAGLGLVAFIILATRLMARRNGMPAGNGSGAGPGAPYGVPNSPYGAPAYGAAGTAEPGLGSRVMGGLATGAAVGAGVVAGEALMHHFLDGKEGHGTPQAPAGNGLADIGPTFQGTYFNDLGGTDFGVTDTSSWDDGAGSDDDWN
ncbi:hypothetical protein OTERR_21080 [Oryzomicrobium terrae]|uniref:Tetratricopeptide repeat protein n=1 Tax=Oryzomicrobium terrae TaxID=1735038 RepID=A0A5C1EAC4_9RHOO|nr:tetratricopeptide repeat protein [Oryzomicrobium terrae]QEL65584.1 hypothetical protein OTERR_21080 [Oryzomicrobium terrae]